MMKPKWLLLLTGFIAVYMMLHIANDLPGLIYGRLRFYNYGSAGFPYLYAIIDTSVSFLYALLPYFLLYQLYPSGKWLIAVCLIIICLPGVFYIHYWVARDFWPYFRLRNFFRDHVFFIITYTICGVVFYFIRYSWFKELQQRDLLLHSRQAELSFLRSQINPHFLFNSLNNIYSLAYQRSDRALSAIAALSELLRYMLYDTTEKVSLQQEVDYIRKYIDLQKLRFEQPIQVHLHTATDSDEVMIPPLLLIPFVENAFKHGSFTGEDGALLINIYTTDQKLHFHCYNKTGQQQKDSGGGIGLENVKRRLSLLYPGKHVLQAGNKNNYFTVNLELEYE